MLYGLKVCVEYESEWIHAQTNEMSSILDKRCCLKAVPRNFLYKFLILSWAIETLRFKNSFVIRVDESAQHIRDCPENDVGRDILAKSVEKPLRVDMTRVRAVCGLKRV